MSELNFRTIADVFMTAYMQSHKGAFIVYPFSREIAKDQGTKQERQRFEQCIDKLRHFSRPALDALYAKKYRKPEIQKAAELFAREVVEDVIEKIKETNVNSTVLEDVIDHLRNLNYIMGFPEEILDDSKMDQFYDELDLDGSEDLVTTYLEIERHFKKIENEPKDDWKQKLDRLMKEHSVKSILEDKILCKKLIEVFF